MRMNMVKENVDVLNKVDGKIYSISEVKNGEAVAALKEFDEAGNCNINTEKTVKINEKNCIAFRFVKDNRKPVISTDYYVKDGVIMYDDKFVCEQGVIVVEEILAVLPDTLILTVKSEKEGYIDLMSYNIYKDEFVKLLHRPRLNISVVEANLENVIMFSSGTFTKEVELEDGSKEKKTFFEEACLINCNVGPIRNGKVVIETSIYELAYPIKEVIKIKENEYAVLSEMTFKDDGSIVPDDVIAVKLFETKTDNCYGIKYLNGLMVDDVPVVINKGFAGVTIKTPTSISVFPFRYYDDKIITGKKEIAALEGYDNLVDMTVSKDNIYVVDPKSEYAHVAELLTTSRPATKFTFANADLEVKTLTVITTPDRGDIITVE